MSIDPKVAAAIAKSFGLNLSDARAISAMAESEDDALDLAQQFAPEQEKPLTRADLKDMSAEEIVELKDSGALDHIIRPVPDLPEDTPLEPEPTPTVPDASQGTRSKAEDQGQLTRAQVERMSPEEINTARDQGRLDKLLQQGAWRK